MNNPPQILVPREDRPLFPMLGPVNPAKVVVRDPDGDRLTAFWTVPGYGEPLQTSQLDEETYTTFLLFLPRIEELHDQTVSVTIVDDDPDEPLDVGVNFTVKVQ